MSENLNYDFNTASKLLESFSCFYEKLAYFSQDPNKNLEKLTAFKKTIYFNMNSRSKIQSLLSSTFNEQYTLPKSSATLSPYNSSSTLDKSTKKTNSTDASQSSTKEESKPAQSVPTVLINNQKPLDTGISDKSSNPMNPSWSKLENTNDFITQIKVSLHAESDEILTFIPSFGSVRSFAQPSDSLFYAFCFAFFEGYMNNKFDEPRISLSQELRTKLDSIDGDMETLAKYLDKQILSLIKTNAGRNLTREDVIQALYNDLVVNSNFYSSCLLLFKKILYKILDKQGLSSFARKSSLRWISELNTTDQGFYEGLAGLFEANVNVFTLSASKLAKKTFSCIKDSSFGSFFATTKAKKPDMNFFYDRGSGYAYILYQDKGSLENESMFLVSPSKRNKQRSHSPGLYSDASLKEISTNLPNVSNEKKKIVESKEDKTPKSYIQREWSVPNTPDLSVNYSSTKLYSNAQDTSIDKSDKKVKIVTEESESSVDSGRNPLTLYNVSKSDTTSNVKDKENVNSHLTPKGREAAPARPSAFSGQRDPAFLVNKIMDEINQRVKGGKTETSVTQQAGKKVNVQEKETVAVTTPMVLPMNFKVKLLSVNKDLNQHSQEFHEIVVRSMPEESSPVSKGKSQMNAMLGIYEAIMNKSGKDQDLHATIGSTMQMDT